MLVTLAQLVDGEFPEDSLKRTVTPASGWFGFDVGHTGDYVVQAQRLGLATFTSDPIRLTRGEPVDLALTLEVEPLELEPLVVTSSAHPWWELLQPPGLWSSNAGSGTARKGVVASSLLARSRCGGGSL